MKHLQKSPYKNMANLNALVDEKISSDSVFQATLADMSQEDADQAVADKRQELIDVEYSKAEELANNQKIRAEKAEALAKQLKIKPEEKPEAPKTPEPMSLKDIRALQDVHDDDVDELVEYAKFKGVSVAEVKKNPVIQAHLKVKAEERTTAQATNIGKSSGRTSKITGQNLLEKAYETGETPTDPEAIKALVAARIQEQLDRKKS